MKKIKSRWFEIEVPVSLTTIAKILSSYPFSLENGSGYEILKLRKNDLEGLFIEQIINKSKFLNSTGEEEEVEYISYSRYRFIFKYKNTNKYIVQLIDPPRSVRCFFNSLSDVFEEKIVISKIIVNINDLFFKITTNKKVIRYTVPKIVVSSILFTNNSIARIELVSEMNAYKEFRKKFPNDNYVIESIHGLLRIEENTFLLELNKSGLYKYNQEMQNIFESSLFSLAS